MSWYLRDLVVGNGWHELSANDDRVVELSNLLQELPIHPEDARGPKFRSPNSVRRKMVDMATHHPDFPGRKTNGGGWIWMSYTVLFRVRTRWDRLPR